MALTDQQQIDLFNRVANIAGWIYAGGPDVAAGRADIGSIGYRVIHVDQNVAGAQDTPNSTAARVLNIDRQVTGADDFAPSVAARVIGIEQTTDTTLTTLEQVTTPPSSQHGWTPRAVLALIVAVLLLVIVLATPLFVDLPRDGDVLVGIASALAGALAALTTRGRRDGDV